MDAVERGVREDAKARMRRQARTVRSSMPASILALRSERIRERLSAAPALVNAQKIALFWPILHNNEVDLRPLVALWQQLGKRLAFPRIAVAGGALVFAWVENSTDLKERGHGFCEPPEDAPVASSLDVVLVPALLVDGRGHRLGYGAGYYDRTLPSHCPPASAVAVAFDFQLASELPLLEHDVPVDLIVTDTRTLVPTTA